jgi:hypothetical protein
VGKSGQHRGLQEEEVPFPVLKRGADILASESGPEKEVSVRTRPQYWFLHKSQLSQLRPSWTAYIYYDSMAIARKHV